MHADHTTTGGATAHQRCRRSGTLSSCTQRHIPPPRCIYATWLYLLAKPCTLCRPIPPSALLRSAAAHLSCSRAVVALEQPAYPDHPRHAAMAMHAVDEIQRLRGAEQEALQVVSEARECKRPRIGVEPRPAPRRGVARQRLQTPHSIRAALHRPKEQNEAGGHRCRRRNQPV